MNVRGSDRPAATGGEYQPHAYQYLTPQPLPKSQRRIIAGFTEGDIKLRGLEHCLAVLLREGMDLRVLRQFEGLTRNRLRETAESVMQRVELRLDKPETPANVGKIKRGYRNAIRSEAEGAKPLISLDRDDSDAASRPEDRPCGPLIDWDALDAEQVTINQG